MATPVIMPKFGMTQEEATVIRWYKQAGESVQDGEPLLEVMTDKVNMDVEAPATGILAGVRAFPDDVIPVTRTIAYILDPDEALPAEALPSSSEVPTPASEREPAATPVARRLAGEQGVDLSQVRGTGVGGRISRADVERVLAEGSERRGKVRATPAARRVAREHGLRLQSVPGTGPRGRIQGDDVRAAIRSETAPPPTSGRVMPLAGMRRIIARRMQASYRTAPHIALTCAVDMSAAEAVRARLQPAVQETVGVKLSTTAMLVRIVAWVLRRHPWLNATLRQDQIVLFDEVNVGVAVALEEGLIVPVVRRADEKGLTTVAAELVDLTARARSGDLHPDEATGSTFTVSNLGMFPIEQFTAIINPPETAILAVGAILRQPIVVGDEVAIRPMMRMTLSADHRVVDGAVAARFLADLKVALEDPDRLLL